MVINVAFLRNGCVNVVFVVIFSEVPDIFLLRMRQPRYIVDLLATIPLDQVARALHVSENRRMLSLLSARRLLKIQRVTILFFLSVFIIKYCFRQSFL